MREVIVGCNYHWWRGDPLPELPPLDGYRAAPTDDLALLARLVERDEAEMAARREEGNEAYVAYLESTPVAYGWVGRRIGRIYEVGLAWPLSERDRLLWDFKTLTPWRGQGLYPQLLQTILRAESASGERYWIGHRGDNVASKRGILKAGFRNHANAILGEDGRMRYELVGDRSRALADPMLAVLPDFIRSGEDRD